MSSFLPPQLYTQIIWEALQYKEMRCKIRLVCKDFAVLANGFNRRLYHKVDLGTHWTDGVTREPVPISLAGILKDSFFVEEYLLKWQALTMTLLSLVIKRECDSKFTFNEGRQVNTQNFWLLTNFIRQHQQVGTAWVKLFMRCKERLFFPEIPADFLEELLSITDYQYTPYIPSKCNKELFTVTRRIFLAYEEAGKPAPSVHLSILIRMYKQGAEMSTFKEDLERPAPWFLASTPATSDSVFQYLPPNIHNENEEELSCILLFLIRYKQCYRLEEMLELHCEAAGTYLIKKGLAIYDEKFFESYLLEVLPHENINHLLLQDRRFLAKVDPVKLSEYLAI